MTCLLNRTACRFFALTIRFAKTNREIASVISARMGSMPSGTSSSNPSVAGANFGWTTPSASR